MCCGCWEEDGSPKEITPRSIDCVSLINELYEIDSGGVGDHLHVITDDFNVTNYHIDRCRELVQRNPFNSGQKLLDLENKILDIFKDMSEDERLSVLGLREGCFEWK